MSSRVFLPGDAAPAEPVIWRQVGAPVPQAAPDTTAQFAQLREQCERRVAEAHAAGVREGEAAGRGRAAAEIQPVVERLSRAIEELGQMRARLRREAEADMVQLSLAVARRILRRELVVDPDALHGLVLGALDKLQAQEICRVRVHPAHAAQVSGYLRKVSPASTVEVVSDGSLDPGAVVFETERGNLDASVESQLQEIERGLTDRLRQSQ